MNINQKGNITEIQVMLAAMKYGCTVAIPYGNCDKYDQLWDINNHILKIQVKTARKKDSVGEGIIFNCYSVSNGKKHKYSKDEIDYFATFWENQCYLIPIEECSTEKTLWFKLAPQNYSKCSMAQEYIMEEVLKNI